MSSADETNACDDVRVEGSQPSLNQSPESREGPWNTSMAPTRKHKQKELYSKVDRYLSAFDQQRAN